jgi:hypothetical protein
VYIQYFSRISAGSEDDLTFFPSSTLITVHFPKLKNTFAVFIFEPMKHKRVKSIS